jgi:tetratricopeptide (TPR) repeat protein
VAPLGELWRNGGMRIPHILSLVVLAACSSPGAGPDPALSAPGLSQLGGHGFPITTSSPEAQQRFDEGLAWCYGFHHGEALRCFRAAAAADPECAMAYWGMAYAAGPHINNMGMTPEAAQQAHADAQRARELAPRAGSLERALIDAIVVRYAWPAPEDRKDLDRAYADAMRTAYRAHGSHPDVAALFAEALMDLRPWDLWQADGSPQPETPEILAVLERLLQTHPAHPQANHLYIHAVEASPEPGRAVAAAERLRNLAPAIGHLVHMPAHTFLRVGRYEDAAEANRRGIAADLRIVERTGRTGFYEIYRAHNYHFLAYACMFTGRADEAIAASRDLVRELPIEVVREMPAFLEGFLAVPYHALVRFGRWEEMLAEPEPEAWQKSRRAVYHYGRGIALAALGRVAEAKREREVFRAAVADVPEDWMLSNNPLRTVLAVGDAFLDGEVEFRAGNHEAAFAALRLAVERDEALRYDEPWGWMMPARHGLGALLLEAGRIEEAEAVYRKDLELHAENGWALRGLAECLQRRGAADEAVATEARFRAAWRNASVSIEASCYCRRNAAAGS